MTHQYPRLVKVNAGVEYFLLTFKIRKIWKCEVSLALGVVAIE